MTDALPHLDEEPRALNSFDLSPSFPSWNSNTAGQNIDFFTETGIKLT